MDRSFGGLNIDTNYVDNANGKSPDTSFVSGLRLESKSPDTSFIADNKSNASFISSGQKIAFPSMVIAGTPAFKSGAGSGGSQSFFPQDMVSDQHDEKSTQTDFKALV